MKLSAALDGFWLDKILHFSPTTTPGYRLTFKRLVVFTGDADIESITANDIRRFLAYQEAQGLSKRSVHDVWVRLSSLWTWAETELHIPHILRNQIKAPDYKKRKPEPFSAADVQALLVHVKHTSSNANRPTALRDAAIVMTLLDTGLRASELCSLIIADYDAANARVHVVSGKGRGGGKERFVITGKRTQKAVWRYLATRQTTPQQPLFATRNDGAFSRSVLRHLLARLGARAHVPNVHPHRFRHTFAITFLRNGGSIAVLKELLGHESLQMVLHYAAIAQQDIDASVSASPVDGWKL